MSCVPWQKPEAGWVKLNFDGSFVAATGSHRVLADMILHHHSGAVLFSAVCRLRSC